MMHRCVLIAWFGVLVAACGSAGPGDTTGGGGASVPSTTGAGAGTTGGDHRVATCKIVAAKTVACCDPNVLNCSPDSESEWESFCLSTYDTCPGSFECEAANSACDADCPSVGSGGC